jgi:hypothetical protein
MRIELQDARRNCNVRRVELPSRCTPVGATQGDYILQHAQSIFGCNSRRCTSASYIDLPATLRQGEKCKFGCRTEHLFGLVRVIPRINALPLKGEEMHVVFSWSVLVHQVQQ